MYLAAYMQNSQELNYIKTLVTTNNLQPKLLQHQHKACDNPDIRSLCTSEFQAIFAIALGYLLPCSSYFDNSILVSLIIPRHHGFQLSKTQQQIIFQGYQNQPL